MEGLCCPRWNIHTNYPSFTVGDKTYSIGKKDGKFLCPFEGCERLYRRRDTMRKHLKDIHMVISDDLGSPPPTTVTNPEGMFDIPKMPHMAAND